MTENETRIIASCWGIIKNNKNVTVESFGDENAYSVYCGKKHVFTIVKNFIGTLNNWEYKLDVDNNTWKFYEDQNASPILKDLYKLCMTKHIEQTQQRENRALKFLEKFKVR